MTDKTTDPYLRPSRSFADRAARGVWMVVSALIFRTSPRPFHAWRRFVLRLFGARLGKNCRIYPGARIWAPWNLVCEDAVAVANGVEIYNPELVMLGSHSTISQDAYLCGATHDYNIPDFPMIWKPITIGPYAWVCARATVQMGVKVGEGAILGLGSIATRDLEPWTIHAGIPARKIKERPNIMPNQV